MDKVIVSMVWEMNVECPQCGEYFDINDDHNYEGEVSGPIFTNKWDDLKGYEVTCPKCNHEMEIEEIDW